MRPARILALGPTVVAALGAALAAYATVTLLVAAASDNLITPVRGINDSVVYVWTITYQELEGGAREPVARERGATLYCLISTPSRATLYLFVEPAVQGDVVHARVRVEAPGTGVKGEAEAVVARGERISLALFEGRFSGFLVVRIDANSTLAARGDLKAAAVPLRVKGAALVVDAALGAAPVLAAIAALGAALALVARAVGGMPSMLAWATHVSMAVVTAVLLALVYAATGPPIALASCVHVASIPEGHVPQASVALANATVPTLARHSAAGPHGIPLILVFAAGLSAALAVGLVFESGVEEYEATLYPQRARLYAAKAAAALAVPLALAAASPIAITAPSGAAPARFALPASALAVASSLGPVLFVSGISALVAAATRRASVAVVVAGLLALLPSTGALASLHHHVDPSITLDHAARVLYGHLTSTDAWYNPVQAALNAFVEGLRGSVVSAAAGLAAHAAALAVYVRWEE